MRSALNKDLVFLVAIRAIAIGFFVWLGAHAYAFYQVLSTCGVTVHKTIQSPDSSRLAVVYETNCGATSGFNTKVGIVPADRPFSPDKKTTLLELDEQHDLAVKWISDKMIEIGLPKAATVYRNAPSVGDVTVEYR